MKPAAIRGQNHIPRRWRSLRKRETPGTLNPQQSEIKIILRAVGARCANVRLQGDEARSSQRSKSSSAPLAFVVQTGDSQGDEAAAIRGQKSYSAPLALVVQTRDSQGDEAAAIRDQTRRTIRQSRMVLRSKRNSFRSRTRIGSRSGPVAVVVAGGAG